MYHKYFAWSFDDGLEQDKKIIEILKRYNMGATFHLNSAMFGDMTYEGRIGNLGITEKPASSFDTRKRHLLSYVPHFRIPADEVCEVYEGFEIAAHTCHHVNLKKCSEEKRIREIADDVKALSEKFNQKVNGFAFPYGMGANESRKALICTGVEYARLATSDPTYRFPSDPLRTPLSSWHISAKAFDRLEEFFREEPTDGDRFFLMFAHGYEFDFNTKESNWNKFERICETVSKHDDIICCSMGEAFRRHKEG